MVGTKGHSGKYIRTEQMKESYRDGQFKSLYRKGKTLEETYGDEKAKNVKNKISDTVKNTLNEPEFKKSFIEKMNSPEIREKYLAGIAKKDKNVKEETKEKIRLSVIESYKNHPEIKDKIREARKRQITPIKDTKIEVKLQEYLRKLNIEFLTHQYMHIEHGYQCDILIPSKNLIIECFGDYWHKIPYGNPVDSLRCQELREKGFKVLVFWEREIKVMELDDLRNKLRCSLLGMKK